MRESTVEQMNGAPLAVCVNDCQLDHGQHPLELVVLCFKVHCAFARMRWADAIESGCEVKSVVMQLEAGPPEEVRRAACAGTSEDLILPERNSGAVGLMNAIKK
jgi:hypothetical protein